MSKILIWPDIYKEQGHWLPCVNLANSLIGAGHSVRFMGIPDCQSIISPYVLPANLSNFFTPILSDIYPPGYSLENKLEPLDQRWKPAHLLPIAGTASGQPGALDAVFSGANKPDLLIGGYFTGLETLMLHYKYGVRIAIITTYLRHPADDPAIHAKTKLVYMPRALSQSLIDRVVPPDQAGMDIETFIQPLEQANELIPSPRELDFFDDDWQPGAKTNYVEPMIVRSSLDGSGAKPGNPSGVPTNAKLIYGTSGSQVQDYQGQARTFFLNLIDMMKTQGLGDYHLVLAVGDKLFAQFQIEFGIDVDPLDSALPSNVHIFPWVSQLDVMAHATVAYMHGGLATIKESIWNQVPIVIAPHGKDQHDNATRIRRNGLGVASDLANLTPEDLRKLFTQATTSTWIQRNLQNMQGLFSARELAKPSLAVIQNSLSQAQ